MSRGEAMAYSTVVGIASAALLYGGFHAPDWACIGIGMLQADLCYLRCRLLLPISEDSK